MKIVICDVCETEIEDGTQMELMVPNEEYRWQPVDVCTGHCLLQLFDLGETPMPVLEEEVPEHLQEEIEEAQDDKSLAYIPTNSKRRLDPDELMENEKRFKEEAAEISQHLGVKNRSKGER